MYENWPVQFDDITDTLTDNIFLPIDGNPNGYSTLSSHRSTSFDQEKQTMFDKNSNKQKALAVSPIPSQQCLSLSKKQIVIQIVKPQMFALGNTENHSFEAQLAKGNSTVQMCIKSPNGVHHTEQKFREIQPRPRAISATVTEPKNNSKALTLSSKSTVPKVKQIKSKNMSRSFPGATTDEWSPEKPFRQRQIVKRRKRRRTSLQPWSAPKEYVITDTTPLSIEAPLYGPSVGISMKALLEKETAIQTNKSSNMVASLPISAAPKGQIQLLNKLKRNAVVRVARMNDVQVKLYTKTVPTPASPSNHTAIGKTKNNCVTDIEIKWKDPTTDESSPEKAITENTATSTISIGTTEKRKPGAPEAKLTSFKSTPVINIISESQIKSAKKETTSRRSLPRRSSHNVKTDSSTLSNKLAPTCTRVGSSVPISKLTVTAPTIWTSSTLSKNAIEPTQKTTSKPVVKCALSNAVAITSSLPKISKRKSKGRRSITTASKRKQSKKKVSAEPKFSNPDAILPPGRVPMHPWAMQTAVVINDADILLALEGLSEPAKTENSNSNSNEKCTSSTDGVLQIDDTRNDKPRIPETEDDFSNMAIEWEEPVTDDSSPENSPKKPCKKPTVGQKLGTRRSMTNSPASKQVKSKLVLHSRKSLPETIVNDQDIIRAELLSAMADQATKLSHSNKKTMSKLNAPKVVNGSKKFLPDIIVNDHDIIMGMTAIPVTGKKSEPVVKVVSYHTPNRSHQIGPTRLLPGPVIRNKIPPGKRRSLPGKLPKAPKPKIKRLKLDNVGLQPWELATDSESDEEPEQAKQTPPTSKPVLNESLISEGQIVHHLSSHDENMKEIFRDFDSEHENSDEDENFIICDICPESKMNQRFAHEEALSYHKFRVHGFVTAQLPHRNAPPVQPRYQCNKCEKVFKYEKFLRNHKLAAHQKPGKSPSIKKKMKVDNQPIGPRKWSDGFRISNGDGLQCHLCEKSFKTRGWLENHKIRRHGKGSCGDDDPSSSDDECKMPKVTKSEPRPKYHCTICRCKNFFWKSNLKEHIAKIHS